jgi:predicted nucleic acid-binding protein
MKPVYADAPYWIALLNPLDDLHFIAIEAAAAVFGRKMVTSELVLTELLDDFSDRGPKLRAIACRAVATCYSNPELTIEPLNSENFQAAIGLYGRRLDKSWSATDCSSLLYIQKRGIEEVLTYDIHFRQMGLRPLLRELRERS